MSPSGANGPGPSDAALVEAAKPWLSQPNVVGVDVGTKVVDGRDTGERAVVVHVVKKRTQLAADDFPIPATVAGHHHGEDGALQEFELPTDVVETGEFVLQINDQKVRPTEGGYQIQADNIGGTGTLGVNIAWATRYRMLTNNHVLSNNGNMGAKVFQPSPNGTNTQIGTVDGYVPIVTYPTANQPMPHYNNQDLAWCDINPAVGGPAITQIGIPTGVRAPVLGEAVVLVGKQTGSVQRSTIASITYAVTMQFPPGSGRYAWFDSLIRLSGNVTQAGDSGSAYVSLTDAKVVGIHMGASGAYSVGCQLWPF